MTPIFDRESYYEVTFVYRNKVSGEITESEPTKVYTFNAVHDLIHEKVTENTESVAAGGKIEISKININPEESVDNKSNIIGWNDMRPGDYFIHISSPKTIDKENEIDYEFYVCKVSREDDTDGTRKLYVDHYQMIWLFYQGAYLIYRYTGESEDDKLLILQIYDTRLCPNIEEVEALIGRQWVYAKIAKYAGMYALESPCRLELDEHMG